MAILLGTTSTGVDSANSNTGSTPLAVKLQASASGSVTAIYLKSSDAVTNRHGAIYSDDGTPNVRLTPSTTPPTAVSGWHKFTLATPLAITGGTNYWLAFLVTGGATYNYTDFAAHPDGGNTQDGTGGAGSLPDPYADGSAFTNIFNAYAEGDVGGLVRTFNAIPFM